MLKGLQHRGGALQLHQSQQPSEDTSGVHRSLQKQCNLQGSSDLSCHQAFAQDPSLDQVLAHSGDPGVD